MPVEEEALVVVVVNTGVVLYRSVKEKLQASREKRDRKGNTILPEDR